MDLPFPFFFFFLVYRALSLVFLESSLYNDSFINRLGKHLRIIFLEYSLNILNIFISKYDLKQYNEVIVKINKRQGIH